MLKKIRFKIFFLIYRIVVKFRSPKLIALMIYISARKLQGIKKAKTSKKMLIIEKSFGIEDIRSTFKKTAPKYEILVIQKKIFKYIYNTYLNDEKITDGYYFSSIPRIIQKKAKLRNFYFKIIYELKKIIDLEVVLSFNYAYRSLRELVPACKLNNVKIVVCQKESNFLDGELPEMIDGLKSHIDKFNGDLMTVYSERYKKLLVETKVVKNRIIKVVGMQRADKFFSNEFRPKQTYVLIFLIQTYRGLFKQNKKAIKFWEDLSEKAIKDILSVAKNYPKVKFIFKTRVPNEKFTKNQRIIIKKYPLSNCKLIYGGDSFKYIKDAKVIIGFNTVALLEGLAAKKKILVPYYQINDKFKKSFTMKITKPIIRAKNSKQFIRNLERIIKEKNYKLEIGNQAKKLLRYHIGNPDGKSYLRFSDYLNSI